MKIKYLLLVFVIFFSSCNSTEKSDKNTTIEKSGKDTIVGSWTLSEVINYDKANLDMDNQTKATLANEMLSKGLMLYFYPDSSYTVIEDDNIKNGEWSYLNEKEVKYGNNKLKIEHFDQEGTMRSMLVTIRNENDAVASELKLVEELEKLENYKEDPFYVANNKWRQRPLEKETNAEIVSRLANYILHNAYLLKSAYERNDVTVTFKHSQGIIKVFKGGIGVVKENRINETWKSYFYDEEDAMKAYYLYNSYLGKQGVIRATSTRDWVKDNYEILMKLYSKIQKRKGDAIEVLNKQNS
ncbi:hypothetical protein [Lacinutrix sp. Hel_I_90]|uniref:hypothetical protein n=1 Tax=Lacinutrix sp. Hel_I_90 TaxID=1249999 RepID=UPI0005CA9B7B|nr:hypothetical protein [Lacinutrix sp. Hel_I_90]